MQKGLKKIGIILLVIGVFIGTDQKGKSIKADEVLTSSDISVIGFQIKTNVSEEEGVSFRALCKAPDKGSIIRVQGKSYTIVNLGTIYTRDINETGINSNNFFEKSYTELDTTPYQHSDVTKKYGFKYIGQKDYNGEIVTFGYIATDRGITEQENGCTTYIRTMTNMDSSVKNTLYIRGFAEVTDEENNHLIVYGEKASAISIAELAYQVYGNSMAPDQEGHDYLYNEILHKLPETNPFYKESPDEYGWGGIVKP